MAARFLKRTKSGLLRTTVIFMICVVTLCILILLLKHFFTITDVTVTGNEHYSDDEIIDFVIQKPYEENSIFLYLKYNNKSVKDIPFVQQMDVEIESPTSVKIMVYEKALAGYVEYLGHYMYFDKDGIVVESSKIATPGIPFVTGLSFDHVVLYEKLPVEDDSIFMLILNITQLLNKYDISTDRIFFDINGEIILYFGNARVYLGTSDYIDEKINEMHLLLPKLEGYSGVLHMENYSGEEGVFSFEQDTDENALVLEGETEGENDSENDGENGSENEKSDDDGGQSE